jgi:isopenicillin-N N-acyltransferase-like protein
MKLISLSGSHYEIGYRHGKVLAGEIRRFYSLFLVKLAERDISIETAIKITRKFGKFIEKHTPDLLEEVRGIAEGAKMQYESVLSLNCMFEIPRIASRKDIHYCTVWGVTDGIKCLAAQNLDLASEYGEFLTLFRIAPVNKRSVLLQAMPGMIGMLGMNGDGLVFSGTTVSSKEVSYGIPKPFIGRIILQNYDNVINATDFLQSAARTTGGNPLLADARGGILVLECSTVKCAVIHPEKGYVASTNHYTDDDLFGLSPPDTESSEMRLKRINWLLEHAKKHSLDEMLSFARDHEHSPDNLTICRHGSISTVSSLVFIPSERCIWIASGLPCRTRYRQYYVK